MTRGELINARASFGSRPVRACEQWQRSSTNDRASAKKQYDDALAYYGQCLFDEEYWTRR